MNLIRVAAAQYPISYFKYLDEFTTKAQAWVQEAVTQQAQLLLFPEYASLELCSLLAKHLQTDLEQQLHAMQDFLSLYLETYCSLAKQYQITIVLGSFPEKIKLNEQVCFVNRSYVAHPDGRLDFQDKQIMTRFESEDWLIRSGTEIKVLETAVGRLGISICYDSEFPLIARKQSELGADIILVPSVTETMHGYFRVKIGSQARALENQCYVVHAPLVGEAMWAPALEQCYGRAGIYTPVDQDFPSDGILAQGELNVPMWVYADLDLAKTRAVRTHGNVLNYRDWDYQQQRIAV